MISSKKVRLMGTNYLLDKNKGASFAFSTDRLYSKYKSYAIEVERSNDNVKQSFALGKTSINTNEVLAFVGANNGFISAWYNQKTGEKVDIPSAQRQQIVNAGALITYTNKYVLEIPQFTTLTVSGISACNRLKNKNAKTYIGFYKQKSIIGYSNDYVYPIKCGAGLMDFAIFNATDVFWYDADGNTSVLNRPGVTLTNAGNTYLFSTDMLNNNIQIISYNTKTNYLGNLKDIPRITYWLGLSSCSNLTGDLSDLGGRITYALSLEGCPLVTGKLSDLGGKLTYLLGLSGCPLITGDLSDLQGKITYYLTMNGMNLVTGSLASLNGAITYLLSLTSCYLVNGVYTPVGAGTPSIFVVTSTAMSTSDIDNTLIACSANVKNNVAFTAGGKYRTSASNSAVANLTSHGWTFTSLTLSTIANYSYQNLSLSIGAKDTSPRAVVISSDGSKAYMLGSVSNSVHQYNLSTPHKIDTGVFYGSFSVEDKLTSNAYSLFISSDGTKMYVGGSTTDTVEQYTLGTAWDITTAVYVQSYSVATQSTSQRKIVFNSTGTSMYVLDENKNVYQYTLGTAWDISTASYSKSATLNEVTTPYSLAFNNDGTTLYASGSANIVYQYTLSTAWDLATISYASISKDLTTADLYVRGLCFSNNMIYMYMLGSDSDKIYEFAV